jgi:hypothetical protein
LSRGQTKKQRIADLLETITSLKETNAVLKEFMNKYKYNII